MLTSAQITTNTPGARRAVLAGAVLALAVLQGCATNIKASSKDNPAPAQAFSTYGRIQVQPVAYQEGYKGDAGSLAKIEANLKLNLAESLSKWNQRPANGRTLVVTPVVEQLSFKSTTKRIFLGPMAGSSGVLMRVTMRDDKGAVVAAPEFFQRADAMSGGFTFGVHDNLMLTRVASLASEYLINNYSRAVGGPTGADDKAVVAAK